MNMHQPREDFGEDFHAFFTAVRNYELSDGALHDRRLILQATPTGLNSSIGSEGGFLVPTEAAADIWEQATIVGGILRRVFKLPILRACGTARFPGSTRSRA